MRPQRKVVNLPTIKCGCEHCGGLQQCLCQGFKMGSLKQFEGTIKQVRVLERGQHLFDVGDRFKYLYAVRSGSVKMFNVTDTGEEQVLSFYLPGEIVGLAAIDSREHSCSAITLETSSICELSFDKLDSLSRELDVLHHEMNRMYAREIARDHAMLRLLGRKNAEQRLASFLLNLSERFAERGFSAHEFNLSMSRSDIGNYLGLALETVSRLLARFQDEELVDVNRRYIHIVDRNGLCLIAGDMLQEKVSCCYN